MTQIATSASADERALEFGRSVICSDMVDFMSSDIDPWAMRSRTCSETHTWTTRIAAPGTPRGLHRRNSFRVFT